MTLLVDGDSLVAWGHPTASILETAERTLTAAGTESTLARGGWKATAVVVQLPKHLRAGLVSSAGKQCVVCRCGSHPTSPASRAPTPLTCSPRVVFSNACSIEGEFCCIYSFTLLL